MRSAVCLVALAAAFGLAAPHAFAQSGTVRVFNWSDYIDESILAEFQEETGIAVVYDVFDSNETLETRLLAGGSGYDVVVPTGTFLARQIEAGVFQPLDKEALTNLGNVWDEIAERVEHYDPGNDYSVNYMWGTTAFGYNRAAIEERLEDAPLGSWDMMFDPEIVARFADCGVHFLDSPEDVIPNVLNYLGRDPDSKAQEDLDAAAAHLELLRPHIQRFHSSEYINALANGDICLAMGYSGDVLQARDRAEEAESGIEIVYVIPEEGALMWFDQMAIPTDAPNPEGAHAFIDYILRPEVAAQASNYVNYANGNLASFELLDESVREDPAIYPDEETLERLFTVTTPEPAEQRIITRIWTRVKTGS